MKTFKTTDGYKLRLTNGVWIDGDLVFNADPKTKHPLDDEGMDLDGEFMRRYCRIVSASIEDRDGGGDGAYGLLDIHGSPEEIGKAIAEELQESDMCRGPSWAYIEDGDGELYLNIRIKFARHQLIDKEDDWE